MRNRRSGFWSRFLRGRLVWEWPVVAGLFAVGIALGAIGYARYFGAVGGWKRSFIDSLYHALQLTALEFNAFERPLHWTLHVARFLLPAVAAYTAIKAVAALYSEQLRNLRISLFVRDHAVVCGLGRRGLLLVRELVARGERVVAIEQDAENDLIHAARDAGVLVVVGDATERYVLRQAGIGRARWLIVLCQDDGLNVEIAVRAQEVAGRRNRRLVCRCHVDGFRLRELIARHRAGFSSETSARVEFFSIYESGAEALLNLEPPFENLPAGVPPHILVVGVGRMGESLVVRLARMWQARPGADGNGLRVTMADRVAEGKRDYLLSEYPELSGAWRLEPVHTEIQSPEFQAGRFLGDADWRSLTRAYVCLDDDGLGLTAALRIEDQLGRRGRRVPVVLRTREGHGLAVLLPEVGSPGCPANCVKAFPLLEHTCTPELALGTDADGREMETRGDGRAEEV